MRNWTFRNWLWDGTPRPHKRSSRRRTGRLIRVELLEGRDLPSVLLPPIAPPPVTISGSKFADLDGNGSQDAGEPDLSGWTIALYTSTNGVLSTSPIRTTVTNSNGDYTFTGLSPLPAGSSYVVAEVLQAGWLQTSPPSSRPDTLTLPDGSRAYIVSGAAGTTASNRDFGNFQLGLIAGYKFHDLNGDGTWGPDEPPLSGWTIILTGPSGTTTRHTDANGYYEFTGLTAGVWRVSEENRPGWLQTWPAEPGTYTVTVTSGTCVTQRNFGNFQLGTISGYKFHDLDGDGTWDPDEPALADWTITLSGPVTTVTTTDANGYYEFTGLPAGLYTITEEQRAGWVQTAPLGGSHSLTVHSGMNAAGLDFGNREIPPIPPGPTPTDEGIRPPGNTFPTTFALPKLQGAGSPPGPSFSFLSPPAPPLTTSNSGPVALGFSFALLLGEAPQFRPEDSGPGTPLPPFPPPVVFQPDRLLLLSVGRGIGEELLGVISGEVFHDLDANGILDPREPGIPDQRVILEVKGPDGIYQRLATAWTDGKGWYKFIGLKPGIYRVRAELSEELSLTTTADDEGSYTVTIRGGFHYTHRDFGVLKPGDGELPPFGSRVGPDDVCDALFRDWASQGFEEADEWGPTLDLELLPMPAMESLPDGEEASRPIEGGSPSGESDTGSWRAAVILAAVLAAQAGTRTTDGRERAS
jgi:protocatechuate 3,4-dioxygenase beta subunit